MNLLSTIFSTIFQLAVLTLIPFLVYLIKARNTKGFLNFIGLKKSVAKANILAVLACLLFAAPPLILTLISQEFRAIMLDPKSITGQFHQMEPGLTTFLSLLLFAIVKTALAEEIFFRGFIAKRLISVIGYQLGNIIQAFIFGVIHAALFATETENLIFLTLIFIVPSIGSYVSVYLNEKLANGSIIPGWISHGLGNILSYTIVGFVI